MGSVKCLFTINWYQKSFYQPRFKGPVQCFSQQVAIYEQVFSSKPGKIWADSCFRFQEIRKNRLTLTHSENVARSQERCCNLSRTRKRKFVGAILCCVLARSQC